MVRNLLVLLFCSVVLVGNSQIVISETINGPDIGGTSIDLDGDPNIYDIVHDLYVTNASSETVVLKVRRLEEDVQADTYNNICWLLCPATLQYAGDNPDWVTNFGITLEPGATDSSFAFHYYPNENVGCSLFKIQWVDATDNDEVFQEVFFRVTHGSDACQAVGINELNEEIEVSMSPNPTSGQTSLNFTGLEKNVLVSVIDVLGQVVLEEAYNPSLGNRVELNTSAMRNGIYFVAISDNSTTLRTLKLVVKH